MDKDVKESRDNEIRKLTDALMKHTTSINHQFKSISDNLQKTVRQLIVGDDKKEDKRESTNILQSIWKLI